MRTFAKLAALCGLALALSGCGYNKIPTLEENAKARWSDVQNTYKERADKIPALVATVKGAAEHEKSTLEAVVSARAKATSINISDADLHDPAKLKAFQDAQKDLSTSLSRLLAVSERYPDLKANQNFLGLQSQIEGQEDRIETARHDYIEAVRAYNTSLVTFPGVLWRKFFFADKQPMANFTTEATDSKAPEIKF